MRNSNIPVAPAGIHNWSSGFNLAPGILTGLFIAVIAVSPASYAGYTVCPGPVNGAFTGCYYNNLALQGDPVFVRTDYSLQFDWGNGLPSRSLPDGFSARWQGNFYFAAASSTFTAVTSDGMKVFIDGIVVLDSWRDQPPSTYTFTCAFSPGNHLVTVEYYTNKAGTAGLTWQPATPGGSSPVISSFTATPNPVTAGQAVTLAWSTSGASSVLIDNSIGDVTGVVSKLVYPAQGTTYRLTALNGGVSATAAVTVVTSPATSVQPPSSPTLTAATPRNASQVDLAWTASSSAAGVAGYQILRNGAAIGTAGNATLAYSDMRTDPSTAYNYALKAYDAGGRYSAASNTLYVTTPSSSQDLTLTSCAEIARSGKYVLGADLKAVPGQSCIDIHDVTTVELDCRQFSITVDRQTDPGSSSAISIQNAGDYSVHNCSLKALNTTASASLATLGINGSPNGSFVNNTVSGGYAAVHKSGNVRITGNTFNATSLNVYDSDAVTVSDNTITLPPAMSYAGNIVLSASRGSTIRNNRIDGGWNGAANILGGDDGILLDGVSNSVVQGNAISNVWDCGIEISGVAALDQISDNKILNVRNCGIGGWYGASWKGNTVTGNTIENADAIFLLFRIWDLQPGEQTIFFRDNVFRNNTLIRQNPLGGTMRGSYIDFLNVPARAGASVVDAGNNLFAGNNFNSQSGAPIFNPPSMIVDGGGNTCGMIGAQPGFPLQCGTQTIPPPSAPVLISAVARSQTQVDLAWTASIGSSVVAYRVLRNGATIASTGATVLAFSDSSANPNTTYSYSIEACAGSGQCSPPSNSASVMTPVQPTGPACPAAAIGAFSGCYYNNLTLSGPPAAVRTDPQINFWDFSSGAPAGVTRGNFSAEWKGSLNFDAGNYLFVVYGSDGVRLYIDGNLVVDQWKDQAVTGYVARQSLSAGYHSIQVDYYNRTTKGLAILYWSKN